MYTPFSNATLKKKKKKQVVRFSVEYCHVSTKQCDPKKTFKNILSISVSRLGGLNLGTMDIWGQMIPRGVGAVLRAGGPQQHPGFPQWP